MKPVSLMKLTVIEDPDELLKKFDRDDISIESKFDGWKGQVISNDGVKIYSRRGQEVTKNFPELIKAISLPKGTHVEGEITYWEGGKQDEGKVSSVASSTSENAEQKRKELKGDFKLFLYDIIKHQGKDVSSKPFSERRKLLEKSVKQNDKIKLSQVLPFSKWQDIMNKSIKEGGEGIVLKIKSKPYEYKPAGQTEPKPGLMFKHKGKKGAGGKEESDDYVVFDHTTGEGGKLKLKFGQYYKGKLYEISEISNLSKEDEEKAKKKLEKGYFVIEIEFQERVPKGLRHQRLKRFRNDKSPKDATMDEFHVKHIDDLKLAKEASFIISKRAQLDEGDIEKKKKEVLIDKDKTLTRGQIAAHYNKPAIKDKIMSRVKGKPVLLYLGTSKNKTVLKRNHNDKQIVITKPTGDDPSSYEYWVKRRMISIHEVFGPQTDLGFIDLDLHGNFPFERAKSYAKELAKEIKKKYSSPTIYQSGGDGIHIEFKVKKQDIDKLRKELKGLLDDFNEEKEGITTGLVKGNGMRTDISTLHDKGSLRVPGSLGENTGKEKKTLGASQDADDPLTKYKKKRDFEKTPELEGEKRTGKNQHRFVIQKHDAEKAKLHYDLRLENDEGALSSFVIPKHKLPSGKERLLVIHTEDHPISYMKFKGEIPSGYGKGHMDIHDSGTYEEIEKSNNKIVFKLKGKKEKGAYKLFKTDGKRWMIMEHKENDAEDMISKKEAEYQYEPNNSQKCGNCSMFRAPNSCSLVEGKIEPSGWCKYWKSNKTAAETLAQLIKVAYIKKEKGKWCVKSEKGKNMGCYKTKAEAKKRLRQIEFFKHKKGEVLNKLINLANKFDKEGKYKLANKIDELIKNAF